MNGAVLIFSMCLQAHCIETRVPMLDTSVETCNMQAQPSVAKWMEGHPGWRVEKWKCVEFGEEDELL